ncbi:MAG: ABC transporter permease [Patescibacteria group bacterium]|nr:ABC transporter permease [Patescibacteria group bacterium]MDD5716052.1 ABC transporter permease [Patescibacteria group bacterium]
MMKLLWANIKMTFRDKQAIFWSLLFPLMFIVIFGLFDFERMGDTKYVLFDNAHSELSANLQAGFDKLEFLKKQDTPASLDAAKTMLANGDIQAIVVIPADFAAPTPVADPAAGMPAATDAQAAPSVPAISPIAVYYDETNITVNQIALSVIDKFIDQMNLQAANAPTLFSYTTENIQSKDINYIDIIMPGILGMAIMTSAVIGISTGISRYREQKLLKRLSATPIKIRNFLIAEVLSYLFVNLIQITLIILVAQVAFGVHVYGNYVLLYLICILGSVIFLNLGFAVAGYSKNTKTAEALSQVITMPMMFFSGVFFPSETLPKVIASVVKYLPLTPMIEALRKVSIDGSGLSAIYTQLAFMAGWIVLAFVLAWRIFKFKD